MPWGAMWALLDSRATGYREGATGRVRAHTAASTSTATSSAASAEAAAAATSRAPLHRVLRGNELREALSSAARTSDLN
eukprot:906673-Pleurochrysis_carterae.AAC.1